MVGISLLAWSALPRDFVPATRPTFGTAVASVRPGHGGSWSRLAPPAPRRPVRRAVGLRPGPCGTVGQRERRRILPAGHAPPPPGRPRAGGERAGRGPLARCGSGLPGPLRRRPASRPIRGASLISASITASTVITDPSGEPRLLIEPRGLRRRPPPQPPGLLRSWSPTPGYAIGRTSIAAP
jgi:hypothetical protein